MEDDVSSFTIYQAKKKRRSPTLDQYLEAAQVFHWGAKEDFTLYFHGSPRRDRRTEKVLKRLCDKDRLQWRWYGKKKVYAAKRRSKKMKHNDPRFEHALRCTRCLIAIQRCDPTGKPIPEKSFKRDVYVPEWAIEYPHGTRLLFEYCTADNVKQRLKKKIDTYQRYLTDASTVALFVLDVSRDKARALVERHRPDDYLLFTDWDTFITQPLGTALTAPIYFQFNGEVVERPLRYGLANS